MDLQPVRTAPGVVAVFAASDIPGENNVGPVRHDDLLFADGLVEYVGQSLFAVAATSFEAARRAAALAVVDYEPLPAVITIAEARAADLLIEDDQIASLRSRRTAAAWPQAVPTTRGGWKIGGPGSLISGGPSRPRARRVPGERNVCTSPLLHAASQRCSTSSPKMLGVLDQCRSGGGGAPHGRRLPAAPKETETARSSCAAAAAPLAAANDRPAGQGAAWIGMTTWSRPASAMANRPTRLLRWRLWGGWPRAGPGPQLGSRPQLHPGRCRPRSTTGPCSTPTTPGTWRTSTSSHGASNLAQRAQHRLLRLRRAPGR